MAQDLIINGNTVFDVERIDALNVTGDVVVYVEYPYPTTGNTVAKIGDTEYKSVAEALSKAVSGDTVLMVADSDESGKTLIVPEGVTLSMDGKTLTAATLVSFGNVIDTPRTGALKVNANKVSMAKNNTMLPIWNPAVDGFVFSNAVADDYSSGLGIVLDEANDKATYSFVSYFNKNGRELLGDAATGADDNEVKIIVRQEWETTQGKASQDFVYNKTFVSDVVTANGSKKYTFVSNNVSALNNLTIKAMVISSTGTEFSGNGYSVN